MVLLLRRIDRNADLTNHDIKFNSKIRYHVKSLNLPIKGSNYPPSRSQNKKNTQSEWFFVFVLD